MDKEVLNNYFLEVIRAEQKYVGLERLKSYFDDYDEEMTKSLKEIKYEIICYGLIFGGYSVSTKNIESALASFSLLALLELIKFYIINSKRIKIVRETDIEDLVMELYNTSEKIKGYRKAILKDSEPKNVEKPKVNLKK